MTTMTYLALQGVFHIAGYQPDGDTLRFEIDDVELWPEGTKLNGRGHAAQRAEGIDTLELHYEGRQQNPERASLARNELLGRLGFKGLRWGEDGKTATDGNHPVPGMILTQGAEGYGRLVSFLFPNTMAFPPGETVDLTVDLLRQSVNYAMLEGGLAYPLFYEGLPAHLRGALMMVAREARERQLGFWQYDRTNTGLEVDSLESLAEFDIFPKIFRRLVAFMKSEAYSGGLDGFLDFLRLDPDPLFILGDDNQLQIETTLDQLLTVSGKVLSMATYPENLVFKEKAPRP